MTKRLSLSLSIVLIGILSSFAFVAYAHGAIPSTPQVLSVGESATQVNVMDFGAMGDGKTDDTLAIQKALNYGKTVNNCAKTVVIIPEGTYKVSTSLVSNVSNITWDIPLPLHVFSNTTIKATGATFLYTPYDNSAVWSVLVGAHFAADGSKHIDIGNPNNRQGCTHGGYTQLTNVTIDGGTWDCGGVDLGNNTLGVTLRHASNITIKNVTFQRSNFHTINLSGTQNSTVENVTIKNALRPERTNRKLESYSAIHLDIMEEPGEQHSYLDSTPVRNATISNCTFNDVYAGIGTNHDGKKRSSNITIAGCEFLNLKGGAAVEIPCVDTMTISKCKLTSGAAHFARLLGKSTNVKILNNIIANTKQQGIAVQDDCAATISGNTVSNAGDVGIHCRDSNVTISNNTVTSSKSHGICTNSTTRAFTATIADNKVSNAGNVGILCKDGDAAITGNTVKSSKSHGICVNGTARKFSANVTGNSVAGTPITASDILIGTNCAKGTVSHNSLSRGKVNNQAGSSVGVANNITGDGNISKAIMTGIVNKTYTGKAQTQNVVLKLGGVTLRPGIDYTLSYTNNVNIGTAALIAKGNGGFTGSKTAKFTISKSSAVWTRLWGNVALDTMAAISKKFDKSAAAIVATSADFKDTLGAIGLAGSLNAPVLVSTPNKLSDQTKGELLRLGSKTVYVVGGTAGVQPAVENQIKALGTKPSVKRIAGNNSSAKAVAAAKEMKANHSRTVIITRPLSFGDALSISPYAYTTKSPVIYTDPATVKTQQYKLNQEALNYIKNGGFNRAIIIGGIYAVPEDVITQLTGAGISKVNITRLAGNGAYETSRVIGEWATGMLVNGTGGNGKGAGFYKWADIRFQPDVKLSANNMGLSRGDSWKDALCGSALCGKSKSILLLANREKTTGAGQPTLPVVQKNSPNIKQVYVFGGPVAIPDKVLKVYKEVF